MPEVLGAGFLGGDAGELGPCVIDQQDVGHAAGGVTDHDAGVIDVLWPMVHLGSPGLEALQVLQLGAVLGVATADEKTKVSQFAIILQPN